MPSAGIVGDGNQNATHVGVEGATCGEKSSVLSLESISHVVTLHKQLEIKEKSRNIGTSLWVDEAKSGAAFEDMGPIGAAGNDIAKAHLLLENIRVGGIGRVHD